MLVVAAVEVGSEMSDAPLQTSRDGLTRDLTMADLERGDCPMCGLALGEHRAVVLFAVSPGIRRALPDEPPWRCRLACPDTASAPPDYRDEGKSIDPNPPGLGPLPMREIGPGEITVHERPALEKYVRTTIEHRGFTFEPAVEWRDGDGFYEMVEMLNRIATDPWRPNADPMQQAELIGLVIKCMWPGRAYFVEVWHGERRGFAQCVQPYGFPRNQSGAEVVNTKSANQVGAALNDKANRTLDDMFAELRSEIVTRLPGGWQAHEMLARLESARMTPAIQPAGSKYPLPTGASASFQDAVDAKPDPGWAMKSAGLDSGLGLEDVGDRPPPACAAKPDRVVRAEVGPPCYGRKDRSPPAEPTPPAATRDSLAQQLLDQDAAVSERGRLLAIIDECVRGLRRGSRIAASAKLGRADGESCGESCAASSSASLTSSSTVAEARVVYEAAKAATITVDEQMFRGLVRAACSYEQSGVMVRSDGTLWDDECRNALELARKIGLAPPRQEPSWCDGPLKLVRVEPETETELSAASDEVGAKDPTVTIDARLFRGLVRAAAPLIASTVESWHECARSVADNPAHPDAPEWMKNPVPPPMPSKALSGFGAVLKLKWELERQTSDEKEHRT